MKPSADAKPGKDPGELELSYLEIMDEENWALSGGQPSDEDRRIREAYRDAVRADRNAAQNSDAEKAYRAAVIRRQHLAERSALCFSGGGIRSATFGLGILQGLALFSEKKPGERPNLLGEFDYLSTVSGGGYLGSWFSGWATRKSKINEHAVGKPHESKRPPLPPDVRLREPKPDLRDGSAQVIRELATVPNMGFEPEWAPIKHLRAYSNYLSPKLGFLSTDTWALAGTVLRNMFLNWLVLLPALAAVLLIPVLCWRVLWLKPSDVTWQREWFLLLGALAMGAWATGYVGLDLPSAGNGRRSTRAFVTYCLIPLSLSAVALTVFWAWLSEGPNPGAWWDVVAHGKSGLQWFHFGIFGTLMHGGGMLLGMLHVKIRFRRPTTKTGVIATAAAFVAGFIGGLAAWGITYAAQTDSGFGGLLATPKFYVCLAFPMLMGVFLVSGTLLVGLTSYVTEDQDREWWARSGGCLLAIGLGWLAFSVITLYSPEAFDRLVARFNTAFAALTTLTGLGAARVGQSPKTPSSNENVDEQAGQKNALTGFVSRNIGQILMIAFMLLLVTLLASLNLSILIEFGLPDSLSLLGITAAVFWMMGGYIALSGVASWFINVNTFSLHAMYRQRLIRAYLGASNAFRQPHPFTGFDENDNISMCTLTANKPMHVVNMALNLVHGSNLGWQERKAASFTSTRLHTGGLDVGYRPSEFYGGRYKLDRAHNPISLGTAITISGAAASPNMGYHSSPLLTLVMTLFNARLGWWLGNPRGPEDIWKRPSPRWGIRSFFDEAFGQTTDSNSWIYLSDGGHFENLAIYEMVLRRCRCIVVSDAGCDPKYSYEDLANAVRKIRIDFGIPIDFGRPMPMSPEKRPGERYTGQHCAIGVIRYDAVDGDDAPNGILVYIKPSLNGNEPADVQNYATANPSFPHEPTSDQFFGESQFESYRRLGMHQIEEILHTPDGELWQYTLAGFVEAADAYASGDQGLPVSMPSPKRRTATA